MHLKRRDRASAGRGWTILFVPPDPTRKTREVRVHPRTVRVSASVATVVVAMFGVWVVTDALDATATADQLAHAQQMIVALSDSLQSARDSVAAPQPSAQLDRSLELRATRQRREASLARPAAGVTLPVLGEITSLFTRSRLHPLLRLFRPHLGVDISAPLGTDITAPAPGRVAYVGRRFGDGLVVELDHGNGVITRYAHCRSAVVHAGDSVSAGAVIAKVGSSGLATGPHVHFEVIVNGRPMDPLRYLISPQHIATPAVVTDQHPVGGEQ